MQMFRQLREDIAIVKEKDPAARSSLEILLTYSGLKAVRSYRRAHWFYQHKWFTIARIISQRARHKTGIEIHPGAQIGKGLFIDHGMGVVIGETTIIGDNCLLYQGVTLGGTGKDKGKRHPTLGDNVMVGAGARCSAPSTSAATSRLPPTPWCSPTFRKLHRCRRSGKNRTACRSEVEQDLDQVHYPDLTMEDITMLKSAVTCLRTEMSKLECQEKPEKQGIERLIGGYSNAVCGIRYGRCAV